VSKASGRGRGKSCELNIEGSESDLSVGAKVVWKRPTGHTGMRFIDIHPDALKGLQRICRTLNLQPISWPPPANALVLTAEVSLPKDRPHFTIFFTAISPHPLLCLSESIVPDLWE